MVGGIWVCKLARSMGENGGQEAQCLVETYGVVDRVGHEACALGFSQQGAGLSRGGSSLSRLSDLTLNGFQFGAKLSEPSMAYRLLRVDGSQEIGQRVANGLRSPLMSLRVEEVVGVGDFVLCLETEEQGVANGWRHGRAACRWDTNGSVNATELAEQPTGGIEWEGKIDVVSRQWRCTRGLKLQTESGSWGGATLRRGASNEQLLVVMHQLQGEDAGVVTDYTSTDGVVAAAHAVVSDGPDRCLTGARVTSDDVELTCVECNDTHLPRVVPVQSQRLDLVGHGRTPSRVRVVAVLPPVGSQRPSM